MKERNMPQSHPRLSQSYHILLLSGCHDDSLPFRPLQKSKLLQHLSRTPGWLWLPIHRHSRRSESEVWLETRWGLCCGYWRLDLHHPHPYMDSQQPGL